MKSKNKIFIIFYLLIFTNGFASENYFDNAKNLYAKKEYEKSKFLFQKNLNTTLLLEPDNEEAMYMIIDIELKRSNFSKVKELQSDFEKICTSLCEKIASIKERLKNFDTSNES